MLQYWIETNKFKSLAVANYLFIKALFRSITKKVVRALAVRQACLVLTKIRANIKETPKLIYGRLLFPLFI